MQFVITLAFQKLWIYVVTSSKLFFPGEWKIKFYSNTSMACRKRVVLADVLKLCLASWQIDHIAKHIRCGQCAGDELWWGCGDDWRENNIRKSPPSHMYIYPAWQLKKRNKKQVVLCGNRCWEMNAWWLRSLSLRWLRAETTHRNSHLRPSHSWILIMIEM